MKYILLSIAVLFTSLTYTQQYKPQSTNQIYEKIQKLNFLGSVLYVAAHPDDENTSMISYYANNSHAQVGYISLTRGDGGQNLIGPEIRDLLGVLRTQELLAARRIDGGKQFFSRANDFGYSKHPDETFEIWNKEEVLSDLVYVIRKFQPDVIINRFDHRTPGTTHGHHTASAMLSVEAFDMANDKKTFPNQLDYANVWQPKRLFYNTSWWFYGSQEKFKSVMENSDFLRVNVGAYYPLRGVSNTEISALSRSQHKCQGFGVAGSRGDLVEFLEPIKGEWNTSYNSIFEGIDTTWNRVEGGKEIGELINEILADFDFTNPSNSLPSLLDAYELISKIEDNHWREIKLQEITEIIQDCAGFFFEVSTSSEFGTRGENIDLKIEVINRSDFNVYLEKIEIPAINIQFEYTSKLGNNIRFNSEENVKLVENLNYSSPYWLNEKHTIGMYTVNEQSLIGLPETPVEFTAIATVLFDGTPLKIEKHIIFKATSPSEGEIREPYAIVPAVSVEMPITTMVFADDVPRKIDVEVKAYKDNLNGFVKLDMPKGWTASPEQIEVNLDKKGKKQTVTFTITPPKKENNGKIVPQFHLGNEVFDQHVQLVSYSHIPNQTILQTAETKVIRLDIKKKGENIGYVIGAGDDVAKNLREIGYTVTEFYPKEITLEKLKQFDAVVLGIRIYDIIDNDMPLYQDAVFEYVKQGGTVITQYNTLKELTTQTLAPYKIQLSHDRVTDENSEVVFLEKKHPILNTPNPITKKDFECWVQERGLYFPSEWGKEFTPILGMNDKGEKMLKSSLLVAEYGNGHFIYTGLSFFRQLPAGVPGAYRLFANMLSIGK